MRPSDKPDIRCDAAKRGEVSGGHQESIVLDAAQDTGELVDAVWEPAFGPVGFTTSQPEIAEQLIVGFQFSPTDVRRVDDVGPSDEPRSVDERMPSGSFHGCVVGAGDEGA